MKIDYPTPEQLPALRKLFRDAFDEEEESLEQFYSVAFDWDRCRCVTEEESVVAALYWFDCELRGKPVAYLYAVATDARQQGKGYSRALMENTHKHLAYLGYAGAILVPATENLAKMYEKYGYRMCSPGTEFLCAAAEAPVSLREISPEEFGQLRRKYLPAGSVLQEGTSLAYLQTMAKFYAGDDFLLTVSKDTKKFFAPELLGNVHAAPSILKALGKKEGTFRTPGGDRPFAMYLSFGQNDPPRYFAFAFE